MGFFDKVTKIAEKAADVMIKTSDKINETYQKEGFDGIINKTADSLTHVGKKTQTYFNDIGEQNKKILDSIPGNDLEGTLAKATAVVINTTQTLVKDVAKVTIDTVDSVSQNIDKIVENEESVPAKTSTPSATTVTPSFTYKEMFLNEGEIAELDCMPIQLCLKYMNDENNQSIINNYDTHEQQWYDKVSQKGGVGSISFVSHHIRVQNGLIDNVNPLLTKEINNSAVHILTKIIESKEYREDLSVWIKEENQKLQDSNKKVSTQSKRTKKTFTKEVKEIESTSKKLVRKTTKKIVKPEAEQSSQPAPEMKKRKVKM